MLSIRYNYYVTINSIDCCKRWPPFLKLFKNVTRLRFNCVQFDYANSRSLVNCFVPCSNTDCSGYRNVRGSTLIYFALFVRQSCWPENIYLAAARDARDVQTKSVGETGQRAVDRDCERRRKDWESVATLFEPNESVEVVNRVTWNY